MIRLIRLIALSSLLAFSALGPAHAQETVGQALCRMIEASASQRHLPLGFFTRLIWRESSFRTGVVSRAGAQGVAQFMPRTAAERGLADPFDPEQAIPASAAYLSDLIGQFGNFGLGAAAYNAGPTRVTTWLEAKGALPQETRNYVLFITGRGVDEWAQERGTSQPQGTSPEAPGAASCLQLAAALQKGAPTRIEALAAFAPWGVQLAGNFSKEPDRGDAEYPEDAGPAQRGLGAVGGPARRQLLERAGARDIRASPCTLCLDPRRSAADGHRHAIAQPGNAGLLPGPSAGAEPCRS